MIWLRRLSALSASGVQARTWKSSELSPKPMNRASGAGETDTSG